jgi:hypothetical protein
VSTSRFTAKKNKKPTKILREVKFTNTENQKHPITPLFNLLAQIAFPLFGNRLHITGAKINRQILNTNVNK